MTTAEVARLYRARRSGKGKYIARCPVHPDRSASLEIKEGKKPGTTIVGCYAGCDKGMVLAAVGITFADLFADKKPDREAIALAEKMRAEEGRKKKEAKRRRVAIIDEAFKWENVMHDLARKLMLNPEDDRIAMMFDHACLKSRILPPCGFGEMKVDLSGVFPAR